jgi:hypothetical protein
VGTKLSDAIRAAETYQKLEHKPIIKAASTAHKSKVKKEK